MSAFMVTTETISLVAKHMYLNAEDMKIKLSSPEEYFDMLFKLNLKAVESRYGMEKASEMYDKSLYSYCDFAVSDRKYATFKAMDCIMYQCYEDGTYETEEFQTLKEAITRLAFDIVRSSDSYTESWEWG